jgi:tetratricopeptide (TPR) repeat protein
MGEWEKGTASLNKAVTAFRAALMEFTRERIPLEWAQTQMNLAVALLKLGELEGGTIRLKKAVAAINAALEVRTRERVPPLWAETQINLGHALAALGEREIGTMRLERAITAYDAALSVLMPTHPHADNCRVNRDRALALYILRKCGFGYSSSFVIAVDAK